MKLLIPLAFTLLLMQAVSELIKRIAIMRGDLAEPEPAGHHPAAAPDAGHIHEPPESEAGGTRS